MLKRRAYGSNANNALKRSSLGQKKRMDGMSKLMARAGRGLSFPSSATKIEDADGSDGSDEEDEEKAPERPFEPLRLWHSPHQGGDAKGLPPRVAMEEREDEFGVLETVKVLQPAPDNLYSKHDVYVPPVLAKWLRPHQREGVQFMYDCVMNLKEFKGEGCILADDMGLGKTLQSVCLIYTMLKTGITSNGMPTAKRIIVICPCSLVKNWENEFVKWLGVGAVKTLAIAEADRATVEKNLDCFVKTKLFNVLIASYECIRAHVGRLAKYPDCCDMLVCDEAHRLKNSDNQTSRALNSLPVKRRVLLTGTPMQNDLQEFFAMTDFTNAGVLGTQDDFRKYTLFPILRGREPDASDAEKEKMRDIQNGMSATVNEFILRRINTLNAEHLPPKLVQVVCCNLTTIQQNMYQHLVDSKELNHITKGKQVNCLGSIQMLMKLCNHPSLIAEEDSKAAAKTGGRRAASKKISYKDEDKETEAAPGADGVSKYLPIQGGGGRNAPVHPEWSGKMFVLYRLMKEMRRPGNGGDKIVIVSNYTQTLDLIGSMCRESSWRFCRLDGSISMKKRQKMVDEFNDPSSTLIAFLLSSKAGGCGLNLIGGNRLVLFDPDWNPAVDKQAAARCWRDGQKKRCFTYRFLTTGSVEEKIFQRQLSKEGLQSVVDDKEQVNALSTKDLKNLFKLRAGTPSDTHDKLRCERCEIIQDDAEMEAVKVFPKKLQACKNLFEILLKEEDAAYFLKPMNPTDHETTTEQYERLVKQPMDFGTIQKKLAQALEIKKDEPELVATAKPTKKPKQSALAVYKSISAFSKDVNRVFANCLKVWNPSEDTVADAAGRLQLVWFEQWKALVPELMKMKSDDDENDTSLKAEDGEDDVAGAASIMNERGENYQEQLGMPDEENMRSWSHHHTTDTVDDPVFRAAMRGQDSVSFVFGLEVTWSLIQQRQQEDEEKKAIKELEAIQEMNDAVEEEDESEEEDEVESTDKAEDATMEPAATGSDNAPDEIAGSGEDDDESDEEEEGSKTVEETSEVEETGTVEAGSSEETAEEFDEEMAETTESTSEDLEAQLSDSSSSSDVAQDDDNGSDEEEDDEDVAAASASPAGGGEANEPTPKNVWACSSCTFLNRNTKKTCGTCYRARPETRKKQRT